MIMPFKNRSHRPGFTFRKAVAGVALALTLFSLVPFQTVAAGESRSSDVVNKADMVSLFSVGGLSVNSLSASFTPSDLVQQLLGAGVTVSNVRYAGVEFSAGTFTGGTDIIGFEDGMILSSGSVHNMVGPNAFDVGAHAF